MRLFTCIGRFAVSIRLLLPKASSGSLSWRGLCLLAGHMRP